MAKHYIWHNEEVHELSTWDGVHAFPVGTYGCTPTDIGRDKFYVLRSMYPNRQSSEVKSFDAVPPEQLPAPFRMHLLLRGIPLSIE